MDEDALERFTLDGLRLAVPAAALTGRVREKLADGSYESGERALIAGLLRPSDVVLDCGAGAGLVAMVAARIVGPANVTAVEANPDMLRAIRRNFKNNGLEEIRLIRGAVMGDAHPEDEITFHIHPGFWSGSITRDARLKAREVTAPVKRFRKLVAARGASAVTMDIEGAERSVLSEPIPPGIRLMVVEMHPNIYGPDAAAALRDAVLAQGFEIADRRKGEGVLAFVRNGGNAALA